MTTTAATRPSPGAPVPAAPAALAGIAAAGCALATAELVAGLVPGIPSPLASVASAVVDMAPPGSKELVIGLFGTADKVALSALILLVVLAAGAVIGLAARRSLVTAGALVIVLVVVGALASLRVPGAQGPLVLGLAAIQVAVGLGVLAWLLAWAARAAPVTGAAAGEAGPPGGAGPASSAASEARRGFLVRAGGLGALAIVGGGVGRALLAGRADAVARAGEGGTGSASSLAEAIPQPVSPAGTPPPSASFDIPGLTPVVVPNAGFYRIDTAFITPSVDLASWSLRVHGMVDREVTLTFPELVALPLIERYVTIACVSNEVGGDLVGNAKWTGPRLRDVLDMAGVQAGATQVVPRSVDGWTAGFPTSWITDPAHPRDAMIAVRMNDQPLPADHGFPARLIVPGLYGYVSATKWLSDIELTTLEAVDAYWVPRGWAKEAPILTQSRIDVPRGESTVAAGTVAVAGVAWAPDRGVSKVEVSVDGGDWHAATLATELSAATWVQWRWAWQATAGDHVLEVRATDGTGAVQAAEATPPNPDGARGHHRIAVRVG